MVNLEKILHQVLGISMFVLWLYLLVTSPGSDGELVMFMAIFLGVGFLLQYQIAPMVTQATSDPVEQAKQEYIESETMSEYEFEQRLEEAMEGDE